MADETTNGAAAPADQQQQPVMPTLKIMAQFIRDMSFENIAAQKGVQGEGQPDIQVQVNLDAKKRTVEKQFEVAIKLNINAKTKESGDMIFGLELDYAGIFFIDNVPDEQMHPFLLIECPRMIFPFVRRIVSDVTRDGGFPPLNLDQIDFVALYRQEIARRAAAQQAAPSAEV
ncbi:protein-export protein SecB [Dinoroseobacter shibae DFL 12 = DSM 16493]|jgi:preprotein translocase subunit SecB|uniref:Protein-export protein SecB n=1 Tax=Dinoroseobacter shibae (strain DSM 16493 / NCIMB 14021 / DFL 12) TaxID=398580 RepID=SECB_DINSH|nr:protein-export chaperone SecB [Dinoroseobacter shibae]A8LPB5.1 RecName: Full=Protein-export protein SecB [Dinoroseobacter shibae DFL 12 = DSM 16493]ABV95180.1 protein-export protein SecB [Dinoroseobacter shibae DFL 12 = DSM 16493]URF46593.1 protein-export chaperone SecB [Dinoroseobacter shibae]URF50899.1 protein-export chaperone SecB [Dinoroseobacter shibae]